MEKPNSITVQLSAFDSMLRAMLHVTSEDKLKEIQQYLTSLWDAIEEKNPKPEAAAQLKASRDVAIKMIEIALKERPAK
ncbi:hypothetical protein [Serratia fonticola]